MKKTLILFFSMSFFFALSKVHAQSAPAKNPKKQTLSFEDELVEGTAQKPELFYLFQKKNFNYKKLIRMRENFLPEMRQTSEELQQPSNTPRRQN